MFGKTDHDGVPEAVVDAFDENTKRDCAHIEFESKRKLGTIQYVNDKESVVHITPAGDAIKRKIDQNADFSTADAGTGFLTLESEATDPEEAMQEIREVAQAVGVSMDDAKAAKSFAVGKPTLWGNVKSLLGIVEET